MLSNKENVFIIVMFTNLAESMHQRWILASLDSCINNMSLQKLAIEKKLFHLLYSRF